MPTLLSCSRAFHQSSRCRGSRQGSEKGASPYMYANHNEMIKWWGIIKIWNCSHWWVPWPVYPHHLLRLTGHVAAQIAAFAMLILWVEWQELRLFSLKIVDEVAKPVGVHHRNSTLQQGWVCYRYSRKCVSSHSDQGGMQSRTYPGYSLSIRSQNGGLRLHMYPTGKYIWGQLPMEKVG